MVNFPFYIIGAIITCILFVKYLLKATITVPNSPNIGNIIPHILSLKVGALLFYPTYLEYINFCYGFMLADLPWLNDYFGYNLGDPRDIQPEAYSIFYINMNFASTYLLAFFIIILLISIVGLMIEKGLPRNFITRYKAYLVFLYNFFSFGLIFAGCTSLQGSILNPISFISINGFFYIFGIVLYILLICECAYKVK
jgi:hypothetical protein